MDYSELANKLRVDRLAQETLQANKEAKANEVAKNERIETLTRCNQRTEELRPLFQQFDGHKIAHGNVTLDTGGGKDNYGADVVCLRIGTISSAAVNFDKLGTNVFSAGFGTNDKFRLEQHRPTDTESEYGTANELMEALATQVSKM